MDIQEYIKSGILEQYVLGQLSVQEEAVVLKNAATYPEIQTEINSLEDALFQYAQASAIPLREGLSKQILNSIDASMLQSTAPSEELKPAASGFSWLPVILGVLFLGTAAYVFSLSEQNTVLEAQLSSSQENLQALQADCDETNEQLASLNQKLNILRTVGNRTTSMKNLNPQNEGIIAFIHRDTDTQAAYLDVEQLPEPPSGKQYQLWYIASAAPQSMGVFDLSEEFIPVDFVPEAAVFAISLEDEGGSPSPTDIRYLGEV